MSTYCSERETAAANCWILRLALARVISLLSPGAEAPAAPARLPNLRGIEPALPDEMLTTPLSETNWPWRMAWPASVSPKVSSETIVFSSRTAPQTVQKEDPEVGSCSIWEAPQTAQAERPIVWRVGCRGWVELGGVKEQSEGILWTVNEQEGKILSSTLTNISLCILLTINL